MDKGEREGERGSWVEPVLQGLLDKKPGYQRCVSNHTVQSYDCAVICGHTTADDQIQSYDWAGSDSVTGQQDQIQSHDSRIRSVSWQQDQIQSHDNRIRFSHMTAGSDSVTGLNQIKSSDKEFTMWWHTSQFQRQVWRKPWPKKMSSWRSTFCLMGHLLCGHISVCSSDSRQYSTHANEAHTLRGSSTCWNMHSQILIRSD